MLPPLPEALRRSWVSTGMQLKSHFSEFFRSSGDWLHCTAHSHHPWPDVTRAAQLAYWDDAARMTDRKWDKVFGEVLPEAQRHITRHLHLPEADQVVFAPNTHEFVVRLYSCLDWSRRQRVLTTAHEFTASRARHAGSRKPDVWR
jgi:selenocysteine lyase/cysteine desulfurase